MEEMLNVLEEIRDLLREVVSQNDLIASRVRLDTI